MKLFLDDYRWPTDCLKYMHHRIGVENPIYSDPYWDVARTYPAFVRYILEKGLPELISFDHDLADGHYHASMQEGKIDYTNETFKEDLDKTGYHAAQWLVEYCMNKNLDLPKFYVHSMNPVGTENIQKLLENYEKFRLSNRPTV